MKIPYIVLAALALATGGVALAQQSAPAGERPSMRQRMEDRVKAADTDKDGLISRAEAEKGMPRLFAHFDQSDTNKDGKLSSDEFKVMGDKMRHYHRGHRKHGAFGGADTNRDRILTRDELLQHQQKMLQDFDAADANKDTKLSGDEMKALHEKKRAERRALTTPQPAAPAAK